MDVKTLSAIIGHISSETTLNIYTHITDNMQRSAANKIEQGFGRNETYVLQTGARLFDAECYAFDNWTDAEINMYLHLMEKYNTSFSVQIEKL